jgi:hypothetical protein
MLAKVVGRLLAGTAEKLETSLSGKPVVTVVKRVSVLAKVVGRLLAGTAENDGISVNGKPVVTVVVSVGTNMDDGLPHLRRGRAWASSGLRATSVKICDFIFKNLTASKDNQIE